MKKNVLFRSMGVKLEQSHFRTIFLLLVFCLCVYISSAIIAAIVSEIIGEGSKWDWFMNQSIFLHYGILILMLGVGLIIIVGLYNILWKRLYKGNNKPSSNIIGFTLLFVVTTSAIGLGTLFIVFPEKIFKVLNFLFLNPGGIFAFITGVFTLIGTFIAIQSILEMKRTITSYPQLLDRLAELIENAGESHDGIMIACYFVLPGYWQDHYNKARKDRLEKALRDPKHKIEMICLNENEHMQMLLTIAELKKNKRDIIGYKEIYELQEKSLRILLGFAGSENAYIDIETARELKKHEENTSDTITLSWDNMPPYYFFVSDHRAIIVTPVGLPKPVNNFMPKAEKISQLINSLILKESAPKQVEKEIQELVECIIPSTNDKGLTEEESIKRKEKRDQMEKLAQKAARGSGGTVETLGFETTDRSIILKLQQIFVNLKESPNAKRLSILEQEEKQ